MAREKFKIEGLKEIKVALRQLPNSTAKGVLRRIAKARLKPIAERARQLVPKGSGALRRSIGVSTRLTRRQKAAARRNTDRNDIVVYAGAGPDPAAHMVEFGTKKMSPQPYLRPAWDQFRGALMHNLASDLWKEIRKAAERAARKAAKLVSKR